MRGSIPQAVLEVQAEWQAENTRLSRQLAEAVKALEKLAVEPGCGCSFPCQCDNKEQLREELNGRMDRANSALKLIRDIGEGTV
jgi:hypothetical protein